MPADPNLLKVNPVVLEIDSGYSNISSAVDLQRQVR